LIPAALEDTAIVGLSFGPQSVKMSTGQLRQENGRWLIDDIVEAVPPEARWNPELDTIRLGSLY
jgi:hypothetical protein